MYRCFLALFLWLTMIGNNPLHASVNYIDPFESIIKARVLGMGNAHVGYGQDINSIFFNPANLVGIKNIQALFSYGSSLQDVNTSIQAIAFPLFADKSAVLSLGHAAFQVNNILYAEYVAGVPTVLSAANFTNRALFIGYSTQLWFMKTGLVYKSFDVGFNTNGINNGFTGNGQNLDLGINFMLNPQYQIGITFKNLLFDQQLQYSNSSADTFAKKIIIGMGTQIKQKGNSFIGIGIDYEQAVEGSYTRNSLHLGVEWALDKNLILRGGINQVPQSDLQTVGTATHAVAGVGIQFMGFNFDYAYYPDFAEANDTKHFLSISYLGSEEAPKPKRPSIQTQTEPETQPSQPLMENPAPTPNTKLEDYSIKIEKEDPFEKPVKKDNRPIRLE